MSYHKFIDEYTDERSGSFEVFYATQEDCEDLNSNSELDETPYEPGWYWRSGFPGCMPDGDPIGPFLSAEDAYEDAQEQ